MTWTEVFTIASAGLLVACGSDPSAPPDDSPTISRHVAVAAGTGDVRGINEGFAGTRVVKVKRPVATGSAALTIHEFTMLEIGGAGSGYFAPQVRLSAPAGRSITVLVVTFSIPGIDAIPTWSCGGVITGPMAHELNGEVYGSWTMEIGASGVVTGPPSVMVTFVDDSRNAGVVTVTGRIVPGSFPSTYTGGENGGPCFHGYRPPG